MRSKSWTDRHPGWLGACILLALAAGVAFWRPLVALAILIAIGAGVFYLMQRSTTRNPSRGPVLAPDQQPRLTFDDGLEQKGAPLDFATSSRHSSSDWHDGYKRPASDYRRPPSPLVLDGSKSWLMSTNADNQRILATLPDGADIVVEAVPEPRHPYGPTTVALDFEGMWVGCWSLQRPSMFRAIVEANQAGFHVLMRARVWESNSRRRLAVRAAFAADLKKWLSLPPDVRGTEFFEFDWTRTDYRQFYEDRVVDLLGDDDSRIIDCTFDLGPRNTSPYANVPGRFGPPAPPKPGTYVDIFAAGLHIGELRTHSDLHSGEVVRRIQDGQKAGVARLQIYPSTQLHICVPNADGRLPRFSQPFQWPGERRQAELARLQRMWVGEEAEVVDGVPIYACRETLAGLKRAGDLVSARELVMKMVDAAERGAEIGQRAPQHWVTLEAAIVLRKLKDKQGEIDVLERYLAHCPSGEANAKIMDRLDKIRGTRASGQGK